MGELKDSGVNWIGDIPENVDLVRLKDVLRINNGREINNDEGSVPVYGSGGQFKWTDRPLCESPALLLGRKGTIDKPLLVNEPFWTVDTMFYGTQTVDSELRYIYYCALCFDFDYYQTGSTVPSMTQTDLGRMLLPFPPIAKQREIADCLDRLCLEIDSLITTVGKQLSTLERYRSSIIHEAVTRGLDPTIPTKPSGVDWIGDIPKGWDVKRLKYMFDTSSGSTPDSSDWSLYDGDVNWVQSGDLYGSVSVTETARTVTAKALRESSALKVYEPPFVVMAMYGASVGNAAVCEISACTNQACCVMLPHGGMIPKYLYYVLLDSQTPLKKKALGGTQPNISQVIIRNHKIPVPPIADQSAITDYLDARTAAIDAVLVAKRGQLDVLKRRRQSLIHEYVTGKRRVAEEA